MCFKAGANMTPREGDEMCRLPFLRTWFRTRSAIVLHLSNGTLQVRQKKGLCWMKNIQIRLKVKLRMLQSLTMMV